MATVSVPQVQKGKNAGPRQLRVFLGAFFILAAVGVLIYGSLQGTQQYYMTLAEMRARKDVASLQSVRIGGGLAPNTTVVNSKEVSAQFTLTDGTNTLPVVYKGVLPDTFEASSEVIAEGKLGSDGVFRASLVLAKCPSKYDPAKTEWHESTQQGSLDYAKGQ